MYRSILLALAIILIPGCVSFKFEAYDQKTVDEIQLSIKNEEFFAEFSISTMKNQNVPDILIDQVEEMHDSNVARLNAWLKYELSKMKEGEDGAK